MDPEEDDRLESLAIAKLRGKGPPKKKTEKNSEFGLLIGMDEMLMCAISEQKEKEVTDLSSGSGAKNWSSILHCWRYWQVIYKMPLVQRSKCNLLFLLLAMPS